MQKLIWRTSNGWVIKESIVLFNHRQYTLILDWKLISATCHKPCFAPPAVTMAINCQANERSYDSEETKVESERCKALKSTIETLCTEKNTAFYSIFKKVGEATVANVCIDPFPR